MRTTRRIDGNPLVSPPPEVVEQGHEAILAYLQDEARSDTQLGVATIAIGIGFLGLLMLLGFRYRRYKQKRISELEVGGTLG